MHCQSGSQEALPQCIPGGAATVDPRRRCQSGCQEAQACCRGQAQAAHLDGQGPRAGMVQRVGVCVLQLVGVVGAPVLPLLGLLGGLLRWGHSLLWRCQEADSRQQDVAVRYVVAVGRQAGSMKWKSGRTSSNAGRCIRNPAGQLLLLGSSRLPSCEAGLSWQRQESNRQVGCQLQVGRQIGVIASWGKGRGVGPCNGATTVVPPN